MIIEADKVNTLEIRKFCLVISQLLDLSGCF